MLQIETIPVTEFDQNARVVWCERSRLGVVVDPGGEPEKILEVVKSLGISIGQIWLTHSHLDHCGGVQPIIDALKVPLVAHPSEKMLRANVQSIAQMYGMPQGSLRNCPEPDISIVGGETLTVGDHAASVLFTPGHSPGHVSFYFADAGVVVSGDTLFAGSIGRTDLPGGDMETLLKSIRTELFTLPPATKVLSGHGPDTTVQRESSTNPFFLGR
jgi:hydroxyacylglutathione hydrolase